MRNITIQVTDEIYHHARIAAASRNMSVSALFRHLILTLQKQPDPNRPDSEKFAEMFPALPDSYLEERADRLAHRYHREHYYGLQKIAETSRICGSVVLTVPPTPLPPTRICGSVGTAASRP